MKNVGTVEYGDQKRIVTTSGSFDFSDQLTKIALLVFAKLYELGYTKQPFPDTMDLDQDEFQDDSVECCRHQHGYLVASGGGYGWHVEIELSYDLHIGGHIQIESVCVVRQSDLFPGKSEWAFLKREIFPQQGRFFRGYYPFEADQKKPLVPLSDCCHALDPKAVVQSMSQTKLSQWRKNRQDR